MSSEWKDWKLEDALAALIDYRGKTPRKTTSGIPLITAKIVKNGRIEKATEFIAASNYDEWMRRGIPQQGDVVLTVEAPLGEVAQLGPEKIALAQRIVTLRGRQDILDSTFLLYLLQSEAGQQSLKARASGSTVIGIKQKELRKIVIKLPDYDYQRDVAKILKSLDNCIGNLSLQNSALESIAQTLFRSWFVNFGPVHAKAAGNAPEAMSTELADLFPSEFEDGELGLIPKGWVSGKLSAVCNLNAESWTTSKHPAHVKYIDLANFKKNILTTIETYSFKEAPSRARRVLRKGDSLFGTVRPGNLSYGYIGANQEGLTGSTGFAVLRPLDEGDAEFVYCAITSRENIERLTHLADGAAYPAVRPNIVHEQSMVIAPMHVRKKFHAIAAPLFETMSLNAKLCRELEQLRDHLLPRLMSGKLRIGEAEEIVAAVLPNQAEAMSV